MVDRYNVIGRDFGARMYKNPGRSIYHPFTGVVVRVSEPEGGL